MYSVKLTTNLLHIYFPLFEFFGFCCYVCSCTSFWWFLLKIHWLQRHNHFKFDFLVIILCRKNNWFHYMCRNYSKNKSYKGMYTSILQRLHRQIYATWVCPQTTRSTLLSHWFMVWLVMVFFFFVAIFSHFLNNLDLFFCSKNECPACGTHIDGLTSLKDNPSYDELIAILYPNIDKYEEQGKMEILHLELKYVFYLISGVIFRAHWWWWWQDRDFRGRWRIRDLDYFHFKSF